MKKELKKSWKRTETELKLNWKLNWNWTEIELKKQKQIEKGYKSPNRICQIAVKKNYIIECDRDRMKKELKKSWKRTETELKLNWKLNWNWTEKTKANRKGIWKSK